MFGFTNIGLRSDHAIAAFLRKHKAIDNWVKRGNSNQWYNADKVMLVAFYKESDGFVSSYWVPDELAKQASRLKKIG